MKKLKIKNRILLHPHPQTACNARVNIKILKNCFIFKIKTQQKNWLLLPKKHTRARCDFLWQTTCLECFIVDNHSQKYWEYNFSPNGAWALYTFDSYRKKSGAPNATPPCIFYKKTQKRRFWFQIIIKTLPSFENADFYFCAVLKNKKGETFYFAQEHLKETPDFHFFPR